MPDDIRTEDDLRAGQVGAYPAGLRLSSAQDRLLRRWPLSRIRPKSVALGMRSLIAEVDTLRAERDAALAQLARMTHHLRQERERRESLERRHANLVAAQESYGASRRDMERRLDALLWVWCSGGCETGTLRWVDFSQYEAREVEYSEAVIRHAINNTQRLVANWRNQRFGPIYRRHLAASTSWKEAYELACAEMERTYPDVHLGDVALASTTGREDAALAAIRALHDGLEDHPVCVHHPEYDEHRWQNGCSFCPLVRPLFDLVPGLVEGE